MTGVSRHRYLDRWSLLALLRFLLASIVAVNHLAEYAELAWLSWIHRLGAFEAILGFLLVSGYSIASSYRNSPSGFYLRRAWRLYPVYIASIVLTFIATPSEPGWDFAWLLVLNLLFLNQLVTSTSYVGPAWTLSLEVWLYALAPWFARQSHRFLLMLVLVSIGCYTINTCGRTLFHWPYFAGQGYGLNLLTLSFPWLLGFVLASSRENSRFVLQLIAGVLAYHMLLSVAIQLGYRFKNDAMHLFVSNDVADFLARAVTLLFVLLCFAYASEPRGARSPVHSRFMSRLGDLSYPLYVTHVPVAILCDRIGIQGAPAIFAMMIGAAAAIFWSVDSYSRNRERRSRHVGTSGAPAGNPAQPHV